MVMMVAAILEKEKFENWKNVIYTYKTNVALLQDGWKVLVFFLLL